LIQEKLNRSSLDDTAGNSATVTIITANSRRQRAFRVLRLCCFLSKTASRMSDTTPIPAQVRLSAVSSVMGNMALGLKRLW
jgi:hypothetical protein